MYLMCLVREELEEEVHLHINTSDIYISKLY